MSEDLWGDISVEKEIKLPVTILKEQATLLGEKTNKILEAIVNSVNLSSRDSVGYSLNIIAPALSNYKYKVLNITHPAILIYPVTIVYQRENGNSIGASCRDEIEFNEKLKEILSSEIVHKVIVALISQSKATTA
jgi:hypothetical protein